ncbi:MAG: class I SAM-dependent methyltransferase [Clostridia bacterium]|nr:class I SAM-dependent methyltransferase [Clostridia bacterium]
MKESYTALGGWFEYLNADCDYLTWSQYLLNRIKSAGSYTSGLDIGCGNGYFTRALNKAGYKVDGVDISESMLSVARQKAAKEGVRCEFLCGDITKLKVCRKVDFCTAVNDCINYVPKDKLKTAFARVHAATNSNGAFFFDISSPNKIRNIIGENLFGEDGEDISYLWFNKQTKEGVQMDLTFFIKQADGRYERLEETHIQYAHSEEEVISALREAGFARVECEGHLGGDKSERIQFAAFKK